MIKADSLVKMFGPKLAVDGVSFEVKAGEVLGFLGPNGAGKSTTMRMITGYLPMTSGTITIDGADIVNNPIAAKSRIGYLPENAPSYPESTVEGFLSFIAEAKGPAGQAKHDAIEHAIGLCQLEKVRHQTIDTLSKGYKHRTCFAQAIINDPPILVLDEPTDGLDPNQKHEMRNLIREMGKTKAIIVSTHILEEVEAICTRVVIIDKGKVVFNGTPAELRGRSPEAGTVTIATSKVEYQEFEAAAKVLPNVAKILDKGKDGNRNLFAVVPRKATETCLAGDVKAMMDAKGWSFVELHTETGKLDEVFRSITSNETGEKKAEE